MTSEGYIEELRRNGVKIVKKDGSLTEIPSDFLERAVKFCEQHQCRSVIYDIVDMRDEEHKKLKVLDNGYAE